MQLFQGTNLIQTLSKCKIYINTCSSELISHSLSTPLKDVTSDQPDRETCALKCHYIQQSGQGVADKQQLIMVNISTMTWMRTLT